MNIDGKSTCFRTKSFNNVEKRTSITHTSERAPIKYTRIHLRINILVDDRRPTFGSIY